MISKQQPCIKKFRSFSFKALIKIALQQSQLSQITLCQESKQFNIKINKSKKSCSYFNPNFIYINKLVIHMRLKKIENISSSPCFKLTKNEATRLYQKINSMNRLYSKTERYKRSQNTHHQCQSPLQNTQYVKQPSKCPSFIIELQKRKEVEHLKNTITIVSNMASPVNFFPNSSKNSKTKDIFEFKANSLQKKRLVKAYQNFTIKKKKSTNNKADDLQTSEIMEVLTIQSSEQNEQVKNDQFFMQNKLTSNILVRKYGKSASQKQIKIKKKKVILNIDHFKIMKRIGKGSYGDVYLVQDINTNALYALKKIDKKKLKTPSEKQQAIRQIKIQSYLQSQVIAPLYGWFNDQSHLYLIMEYFQTGTLSDLLRKKGKLSENQSVNYIKQLCKAIDLIHKENIIHRDLKAENIFLHNITAKIGDFGCSIFTKQLRQSVVGCYVCLSPEQLQTQKYDQKVDIWSLGVICYEMLMGYSPFSNQLLEIINKKKSPTELKLKFPDHCKLSTAAKNFIKKCLSLNPANRPSASELLSDIFLNMSKESKGHFSS